MTRSGTFTTARVSAGVVVNRALHRERLRLDGGDDVLVEELVREADARAAALGDGMVRVVVDGERSRVEAGPARRPPWREGAPSLSLIVRPDPRRGEGLRRKVMERDGLEALDREAREAGSDGALLVGPDETLREGTWFSFLLFLDGAWCAPPLGEGVIFSTTREALSRALSAVGEPLEERSLTLADVARAEGAAALSALMGSSAVWRVGDVVLERSVSLTRRLLVHLAPPM